MPLADTIAISFGNWIVAFYVVYALTAIALVAAAAMLIDWSVRRVKASRVAGQTKASRKADVAQSRA